jgi:hypothetical protein
MIKDNDITDNSKNMMSMTDMLSMMNMKCMKLMVDYFSYIYTRYIVILCRVYRNDSTIITA